MLEILLAPGWADSPSRIIVAAVVTASFALLALAVRGVNRSGALAGGVACLVLFICGGPPAFVTLVSLFVLTWAATRFGFRRKQQLGLAERREGRNACQVLANLAVAAVCALLSATMRGPGWLVVTAAALAEAATDTVASEIGQIGARKSRLITSWKPVLSGTDGGITFAGTLAGALAGTIVSWIAALTRMYAPAQLWIPALAGFVGMLADSFMGATLQRRSWINNDAVNLLGTAIAAATAIAFLQLA